MRALHALPSILSNDIGYLLTQCACPFPNGSSVISRLTLCFLSSTRINNGSAAARELSKWRRGPLLRVLHLERTTRHVCPDFTTITLALSMATRRASLVADDHHLAALGVKQELKRNFSPLSMLGLAFAILNSWTALSTSMSLALPSGGPTSVIWGLITAGVFNLCLATSLAEFLSAYPTAGGQCRYVLRGCIRNMH